MEVKVPLGTSQWVRNRAGEPVLTVTNRFFEKNPTNTKTKSP
jgi:hypothetical protein